MRRTLLMLSVLFVAYAQSQPPSPAPGESTQNNESKAKRKQTVTSSNQGNADSISAAIDKLTSEVASWKNKQSAEQGNGNTSSGGWLKWSTIITALATLTIAGLGGLQWWAMRGQRLAMETQTVHMREALAETRKAADAAKESAEAARRSADALINSERAWAVVGNINPPIVKLEGYATHYEFSFDLVNRGRTVARIGWDLPFEFRLVPSGEALPAIPDYGPLDRKSPVLPMHGTVLAPGDSIPRLALRQWRAESEDVLSAIAEGRRKLYLYASLKYFDLADNERNLQFCYRYMRAGVDGSTAERWLLDGPPEYNKHT